MRVVALDAIGRGEWLVLVRLLQIRILGVVAVKAERRRGLGEMEAIVHRWLCAGFVGDMAGVAADIERGVTASLLWHIQAGLMAIEAKILFFPAGRGLQKLILVIARVRVVAGEAVANRRRMDCSLDLVGFFVGMAGDAKRIRRRGDQLDASDIFVDPDFVAAQAARAHRGVN